MYQRLESGVQFCFSFLYEPFLESCTTAFLILNFNPNASFSGTCTRMIPSSLGNTNDTARWTSTSIASLLALFIAALAEVIGARMYNNSASQHTLRSDQFDELVSDGALGVARAVSLEVAKISDVTLAIGGSTMGLVEGIDCVKFPEWELVSER